MAFTIAIDGPAASGKGTLARALAAHYGFEHMDTGLLYRAVGLKHLGGLGPEEAAKSLTPEDLQNDALRSAEASNAASVVAALPDVRAALLDFQRAFARRAGGAVLDGRDIGTVVCPEAEVKLFVTASAETRAERRFKELTGKGTVTSLADVLSDIQTRDARDSRRADAPLCAATDAITLDTTTLSIDDALAQARQIVDGLRN